MEVLNFIFFALVASVAECTITNCAAKNEEWLECGTACPLTCENKDNPPLFCTANCVVGCFCKKGFVRGPDKSCITPDQCPPRKPVCKANEIFKECGTACPLTCENKDDAPLACTKQCVAGCFCVDGFVHDPLTGLCVLPEYCSFNCSKHEHFEPCSQLCDDLTCEDQVPHYCRRRCIPRCMCDDGFVRSINGKCIKKCACPAPLCPAGEEWSDCGAYCQRTCGLPTPCAAPPQDCNPGCVCPQGFVRETHGGKCIPQEKCPNECTAGEVWSECGANSCQMFCEWYYNPDSFACRPICTPGCICEEPLIRGPDGNCISPQECPAASQLQVNNGLSLKPKLCKVNEEWSKCDAHGCLNTCEDPDLITRCTYLPGCYPGCICKEGYLRNKDGSCVPEENCLETKECFGLHEEYQSCGTACPKTCENKDQAIKCIALCVSGCFCKQGYVRDKKGNCILPEECPRPCLDPNEYYTDCGTACPKDCSNYKKDIYCIDLCKTGCFCKEGFIRGYDGRCIEPSECECKCNEEWSDCGANGCQNTCEDPTFSTRCRGICTAGCVCKQGYVRDAEGNCVSLEACKPPIICNELEVYTDCGTACPLTCENYENPPICTLQCVPGCFCLEPYIRDSQGNCILSSECPPAICLLPLETGPCKALFYKWGYSSALKRCVQFKYGGCLGNENNFDTEAKCEATCL